MLSRTVSMMYIGCLDTPSFTATSRKDGPERFMVTIGVPYGEDELAGAAAAAEVDTALVSPDELWRGCRCVLSECTVSSLLRPGNTADVDILGRSGEGGRWVSSSSGSLFLVESRKGVMREPPLAIVGSSKREMTGRTRVAACQTRLIKRSDGAYFCS